jgi:uncharacterized membrane protein
VGHLRRPDPHRCPGQASIDAVAGPVGEALIMTALGLFVANPAVVAYNFFVRSNRNTNAKFDTFAHDLHDFFATGSRVGRDRRPRSSVKSPGHGVKVMAFSSGTAAAVRWRKSTSRPSWT